MRNLAALLLLSLSMSACAELVDLISQADAILERYREPGAPGRRGASAGERSPNFIPRAAEVRASERRMREIIRNPEKIGARPGARRVSPFDPRYERLARVFHRVVSASHAADEIERSVRFVYFDDPLWNAAALGGNKMVFFTGLTDDLDDEELAAVIGHEMAHNAASHVSDRVSSQTFINLAGGRTGRKGRGATYSFKEEEEADKMGILYAALAGYDPYAASRLWARGPGRGRAYFRTHPAGPGRVRRARNIADKARRYYVPGQLNPRARREEGGGRALRRDQHPRLRLVRQMGDKGCDQNGEEEDQAAQQAPALRRAPSPLRLGLARISRHLRGRREG